MNRHRLSAIFLLAVSPLTASAACTVTEKQLLGSWAHASGPGFFEEMAFELDGLNHSFSSWLHQRPEIVGATWSLGDCRLVIDGKDDKTISFKYAVAIVKGGLLELRADNGADAARYKRVP